jgi:hypothetical protein
LVAIAPESVIAAMTILTAAGCYNQPIGYLQSATGEQPFIEVIA